MNRFTQLRFAPMIVFILAVIVAHGGNDKAPILVLGAALFSLALMLLYLVKSFLGARGSNLRKAFWAGAPFVFTAAIFLLAKFGLVDPRPILGFK
ncbi:MAG TPA: hypothetical protein VEF76_04455 [Patescibacteria group bacterium]|nr:hypothetical protein [Patescibacteria group bacterium]